MGDINSTFVKPRATDVPSIRGTTPPDIAEPEDDAALQDQIALKRAKALEDQMEARPLKKKQEELEKQAESALPTIDSATSDTKDSTTTTAEADTSSSTSPTLNGSSSESSLHHKQALLKNDDKELKRVDMVSGFSQSEHHKADANADLHQVLREIHGRFFEALSQSKGGLRTAPSSEPDPNVLFDVRVNTFSFSA